MKGIYEYMTKMDTNVKNVINKIIPKRTIEKKVWK